MEQNRDGQRRGGVYPLAMTGVMAAVLCVISPFTLSVGPIPISLCTLGIYLTAYVLGWKRGTTAVLVYVLLGAAGVPVFSNFGAGLGKLLGPTGGYIVGYLLLAPICGWFISKFPGSRPLHLAGLVLGTAVLYALGTAWYCVQSGAALGPALALCVYPFLPGDAIKIAAVLWLGPLLRSRLVSAGVYRE